jgi:hypothetical protein
VRGRGCLNGPGPLPTPVLSPTRPDIAPYLTKGLAISISDI